MIQGHGDLWPLGGKRRGLWVGSRHPSSSSFGAASSGLPCLYLVPSWANSSSVHPRQVTPGKMVTCSKQAPQSRTETPVILSLYRHREETKVHVRCLLGPRGKWLMSLEGVTEAAGGCTVPLAQLGSCHSLVYFCSMVVVAFHGIGWQAPERCWSWGIQYTQRSGNFISYTGIEWF